LVHFAPARPAAARQPNFPASTTNATLHCPARCSPLGEKLAHYLSAGGRYSAWYAFDTWRLSSADSVSIEAEASAWLFRQLRQFSHSCKKATDC
jgi:hypothetical protein